MLKWVPEKKQKLRKRPPIDNNKTRYGDNFENKLLSSMFMRLQDLK